MLRVLWRRKVTLPYKSRASTTVDANVTKGERHLLRLVAPDGFSSGAYDQYES